ncbi:MAG TPA: helix-turn-helix domain-containing protein [Caldimonas sp.]|nr:helix-turn-helix domain-containing protein [Caldimonas sp.]
MPAAPAAAVSVLCSTCHLHDSCLPAVAIPDGFEDIDGRLVAGRRKVALGEALFRAGDPFDSVFAIWTGFLKTVVTGEQGAEQVTGFHMAGEMVGFDGIDSDRHEVDAIALEDSQVCVIPFANLQILARTLDSLQKQVYRWMSREIVNDHDAMLRLGSMTAEERLAAFLLDLTGRLRSRGFSASSVLLRMSRQEIGSYLGVKLETVSRTFSKFQAAGLLFVSQRQVLIADAPGLRQVLERGFVS